LERKLQEEVLVLSSASAAVLTALDCHGRATARQDTDQSASPCWWRSGKTHWN